MFKKLLIVLAFLFLPSLCLAGGDIYPKWGTMTTVSGTSVTVATVTNIATVDVSGYFVVDVWICFEEIDNNPSTGVSAMVTPHVDAAGTLANWISGSGIVSITAADYSNAVGTGSAVTMYAGRFETHRYLNFSAQTGSAADDWTITFRYDPMESQYD